MSAETKLLACPECDWLDGEHAPYCPRAHAPTAQQHPDNDPAEIALRDDISAENLRLIDHIANRIGLPHDQELTTQLFDDWYAECRSPSTARNAGLLTEDDGSGDIVYPTQPGAERIYAAPPSPDTVREALQALEAACQKIAAGRTDDMYHDMINAGQQDDLLDLDNARRNARAALSSAPVAPAAPSIDSVAQRIERSEPDEGRKDAGSTPVAISSSTAPVAGAKDPWQDISTAPKDRQPSPYDYSGPDLLLNLGSHADVGSWFYSSAREGDGWWTCHTRRVWPVGWMPIPPLADSRKDGKSQS